MTAKPSKRKKINKIRESKAMLFGRKNYLLLGVAITLLVVSFGGMYIENEFKGWFSLYIAPILAIAGFITVVFAILGQSEAESEPENQ